MSKDDLDEDLLYASSYAGTEEDFGISVRFYNCMMNSRIRSLADLRRTSDQDLLKIKNFGKKCLKLAKRVQQFDYPNALPEYVKTHLVTDGLSEQMESFISRLELMR